MTMYLFKGLLSIYRIYLCISRKTLYQIFSKNLRGRLTHKGATSTRGCIKVLKQRCQASVNARMHMQDNRSMLHIHMRASLAHDEDLPPEHWDELFSNSAVESDFDGL